MDVYGVSAPEGFRIDDLLDFSNEEIFSSSGSSSKTTNFDLNHQCHPHQPYPDNNAAASNYYDALLPNSADFTDKLCVPSDDVAELEWLSNFVEDSSSDFPSNTLTGTMNLNSNNTSLFHSKSRSKRSRANTANTNWTSSLQQDHNPKQDMYNQDPLHNNIIKIEKESSVNSRERSCPMSDIPRKCTHCASEKTPQWRTGPLGPKTLCNACGVRYKSGRLVPEYRPAASPTFVLTQHSNSHRKVMELRRQKEVHHQQQQPQQQGTYGHHFQLPIGECVGELLLCVNGNALAHDKI